LSVFRSWIALSSHIWIAHPFLAVEIGTINLDSARRVLLKEGGLTVFTASLSYPPMLVVPLSAMPEVDAKFQCLLTQ